MNSLHRALAERRVTLLTGPRQSGKTTLARAIVSETITYRTLDDPTLRQAAEADPLGFLRHAADTLIIDEIQRVPDLLPAIKKIVDEDNRPGQFLLTGSVNLQDLPSVRESLAGRVSKIRLRPLSHGELLRHRPDFLGHAFTQDFSDPREIPSRDALIDAAFRGGFPEAARLLPGPRRRWHRDYIQALLDRDLRDVVRIQRADAMQALIRTIAAWSSKLMDISAIGAGLSLTRPTLTSYINALEALYLVERVHPWTKTEYERVGRQDKLFLSDCGLMTSLLGWQREQIQFDSDRIGKLLESFVFNEIVSQIDVAEQDHTLFHYRDREKREIDFLIEREDGALLGLEVKAAETVKSRDFRHLAWFRDTLAKDRPFIGMVLYTGSNVAPFGPGLWAVPIAALWS